jgi:hypothetical protein
LAKITPVKPPTVNRKINPIDHKLVDVNIISEPCRVDIQLKILIAVGTAITKVAVVKYARESTSIPTVNM